MTLQEIDQAIAAMQAEADKARHLHNHGGEARLHKHALYKIRDEINELRAMRAQLVKAQEQST